MAVAVTLRPVTWEVCLPLTGQVLAIVQAVELGQRRERYYRSVTANPDRSQRVLIGYWATPDEAHDGTLALYEQKTGRSVAGGDLPASMPLVPQKPPPTPPDRPRPVEHVRGMAARPQHHASRR